MQTDEILLSSDKTIAVIDGSGVLADPAGINREELVRLAKLRVPIANFDASKLSKDGYKVLVEDQDVKLPCESDNNKCPGSNFSVKHNRHYQLVKSLSMEPISAITRT